MFGAISVGQEFTDSGDAKSRPRPLAEWRERNERAAVDRLALEIEQIGEYADAPLEARERVLRAVTAMVRHVDLSRTGAAADRYGRRVLREEPTGWSLAAVTLRHGQATE